MWALYHLYNWVTRSVKKNPIRGFMILVLVILTLWVLKPYFQPSALWVRIHMFEGFVILLSGFLAVFFFKRKRGWPALIASTVLIALCVTVLTVGKHVRDYNRLYRQYVLVEKLELDTEPVTAFDRLQPRHSIHISSNKRISDVKRTTVPNFVRWKDGTFVWSLGVEPEYWYGRLTGKVDQIFVLPGQSSELDFSQKNQEEVNFASGESMAFLKDLRYLVRQGFGGWRYFNYEPGDVKYVPGPDGKVVQIVSLIKWEGIIFPRPVFGGVVCVKQTNSPSLDTVRQIFSGEGDWIKPRDVAKHPWLSGQDILPYDVSRNIAESFRFRYGYKAPMPGFHIKDIRIPDMIGDHNEQPFSTYFSFGEGDKRSKLYHYFALEPYSADKRGLNTSVFIPADSVGPVMFFGHDDRNQNLIGVSAVATYIKDSNKTYDWSRSDVAEHRPWIRDINGERRHFWLSTVVTKLDGFEDGAGGDFIAGSAIEIFLTDSRSGLPIKVTASRPDLWIEEVYKALNLNVVQKK
jgi:hypothetical protein